MQPQGVPRFVLQRYLASPAYCAFNGATWEPILSIIHHFWLPMFKVVEADGHICEALSPPKPSRSTLAVPYTSSRKLRPKPSESLTRVRCTRSGSHCPLSAVRVWRALETILMGGLVVRLGESVLGVLMTCERQVGSPLRGASVSRNMRRSLRPHSTITFRFRPNIVFRGAGAPFMEGVIKELVIPKRETPRTVH